MALMRLARSERTLGRFRGLLTANHLRFQTITTGYFAWGPTRRLWQREVAYQGIRGQRGP
jgi:hypothetical protein